MAFCTGINSDQLGYFEANQKAFTHWLDLSVLDCDVVWIGGFALWGVYLVGGSVVVRSSTPQVGTQKSAFARHVRGLRYKQIFYLWIRV